jgi:hypothetical protein
VRDYLLIDNSFGIDAHTLGNEIHDFFIGKFRRWYFIEFLPRQHPLSTNIHSSQTQYKHFLFIFLYSLLYVTENENENERVKE